MFCIVNNIIFSLICRVYRYVGVFHTRPQARIAGLCRPDTVLEQNKVVDAVFRTKSQDFLRRRRCIEQVQYSQPAFAQQRPRKPPCSSLHRYSLPYMPAGRSSRYTSWRYRPRRWPCCEYGWYANTASCGVLLCSHFIAASSPALAVLTYGYLGIISRFTRQLARPAACKVNHQHGAGWRDRRHRTVVPEGFSRACTHRRDLVNPRADS